MPFLRAALIKKQALPEFEAQEEIHILPQAAETPEPEPAAVYEPAIDDAAPEPEIFEAVEDIADEPDIETDERNALRVTIDEVIEEAINEPVIDDAVEDAADELIIDKVIENPADELVIDEVVEDTAPELELNEAVEDSADKIIDEVVEDVAPELELDDAVENVATELEVVDDAVEEIADELTIDDVIEEAADKLTIDDKEESIEADNDTPKDSEYVDGPASSEDVPPDDVPEDSTNVPDVQEVQEAQQEESEQDAGQELKGLGEEQGLDELHQEIFETVTDTSPESELEQKADADEANEEFNGLPDEMPETATDTSPESEAELEPEPETDEEPNGLPEEILEAVTDTSPEQEPESATPAPASSKDYSGDTLNYDFTSGERYVDTVSTKTEFDKMLDELASISRDLLSHEVEKFAVKFTGKFQGDNDKAEADAKKYTAFLGGYITNAAMTLYDNGYRDAAIKQLDQAKSILEARKKLEEETEAIKTRVEEDEDTVDLTDILGLFGD